MHFDLNHFLDAVSDFVLTGSVSLAVVFAAVVVAELLSHAVARRGGAR
jgi:phosphatidylglycerophosphate synthase